MPADKLKGWNNVYKFDGENQVCQMRNINID